jgi:HTH-type transcriptional regulator/antitoxin HigA
MAAGQKDRAMAIKSISSEAEYAAALDEIETYFDKEPAPETAAAGRFDLLAQAIENYEQKQWPIVP